MSDDQIPSTRKLRCWKIRVESRCYSEYKWSAAHIQWGNALRRKYVLVPIQRQMRPCEMMMNIVIWCWSGSHRHQELNKFESMIHVLIDTDMRSKNHANNSAMSVLVEDGLGDGSRSIHCQGHQSKLWNRTALETSKIMKPNSVLIINNHETEQKSASRLVKELRAN